MLVPAPPGVFTYITCSQQFQNLVCPLVAGCSITTQNDITMTDTAPETVFLPSGHLCDEEEEQPHRKKSRHHNVKQLNRHHDDQHMTC